jgi:arylsulfatase A-like enzyme
MSQRQPNIVFVFTDQQRWDTAGCYGNPMGLTPVLDEMAAGGTLFQQAFTCQPVCGPARACLQSGMYATATGCFRNGIALPTGIPTLAGYLRQAGYYTGYIGKWHLAGQHSRNYRIPPEHRAGYEHWCASEVLEHSSHPYDGCLFDNDGKSVRLRGYRVDAMTDLMLEFLRGRARQSAQPFFLFLSYLEPHFQNDMLHFVAPDGYAEQYGSNPYIPPDLAASDGGDWREELPGYYGICKSIDENLGRIRVALRQLGLADDTIVIFTSDHGCHFRTRNGEYKRSCHESSIRIPLVLEGRQFTGGGSRGQMASLIDLPATILSAAGAGIPPQFHGRDLATALQPQAASSWLNEVFIQISEAQVGRAIRTDRWKYSIRAPHKEGGRDSGSDLYVEDCLYDLQADPYELNNLARSPQHREVAAHLCQRLLERMRQAGEPMPTVAS